MVGGRAAAGLDAIFCSLRDVVSAQAQFGFKLSQAATALSSLDAITHLKWAHPIAALAEGKRGVALFKKSYFVCDCLS